MGIPTSPRDCPAGTRFFGDDNVGLLALLPPGSDPRKVAFDGGKSWSVTREGVLGKATMSTWELEPASLEAAFVEAGFPKPSDPVATP